MRSLVNTFSRGDWLGNPANIKVENNGAVGYVGMLLKRGTGSGERGAGSGERGAGNGERKSGNELSAETSIKIQYGR